MFEAERSLPIEEPLLGEEVVRLHPEQFLTLARLPNNFWPNSSPDCHGGALFLDVCISSQSAESSFDCRWYISQNIGRLQYPVELFKGGRVNTINVTPERGGPKSAILHMGWQTFMAFFLSTKRDAVSVYCASRRTRRRS